MKTCSRCKIEKPTSSFNKRSSSKDGLHQRCKECYNIETRNWDTNRNLRDIKKYRDIWRSNNPEKYKAQTLISDARRRNPARIIILYKCDCESKTRNLHHPDYSKPYEVYDFCPSCHKKEHARLRLLAAQSANDSSNPEALRPNILERPADMTAIAATR
jgi:hypothetical protein